ncbi:MAG TPA: DUF4097 family beta strand repeat-containing protein [Oligoflexia bacterium]|nr:DUF4097 family beta strand repeat-containing protein [Oligoflexia bacterium]HMR25615.1 DUF4097 family beta strand repeat-containing protein [Oligoflexia bacterium]
MMIRLYLFQCIVVTLFTSLVFAFQTENFSAKGLKELHLKNLSGDVVITASKSNQLKVDYEKIKFSEHCSLAVDKKPESIWIEVKKNKKPWGEDCKVNFEISLPKKTDMEINIGSGNLNIIGVEGESKINIGSGDLSYKAAWIDEITVKSGSGDINIHGLAGEVDILTGSGDVDLDYAEHAVPASLVLRSGSGSIAAKGLKGDTDIITGSGSIELSYNQKLQDKGEISIKSGSGDAKIHFPKSLSAVKVDHKAASGRVKSDIAQKDDAAWSIYMRSASGDLKIIQ